VNQRETILLVFAMDLANGRMHAVVDEWGLAWGDPALTEADVDLFTYTQHSVIGNALLEVAIEGSDPVDCEIIIPTNVIPGSPKKAAAEAVEYFKKRRGGT